MQPATNRLENLRALRLANSDGAFSTAFATLVTGGFLVGFIKYLGGSDIWVGLVAAVPSLLGILQIAGGIWGRGFSSYKRFVAPGGTVWRALYIPVIFLPLLPVDDTLRLWLLATLVSVAAASVLLVNPVYNDWLAQMVPEGSRGYFFSRRNALTAAVGAAAGLLGGLLLDAMKSQGMERQGFALVYAFGVICAAISLIFYFRMPDIKRPVVVKQNFPQAVQAFGSTLKDRNFRYILLFLSVFFAGQTVAGNLYTAFALETLKLPFTILQMTTVMQAIGNILSAPLWGLLADKYGNKPVLILSGFGLTLTPVMWFFCLPNQHIHNAAILLPAYIVVGAIWAGVNLSQFNILLTTGTPEERASFLGVAMAVQALVGFIAPLVGAQLLATFRVHYSAANAYLIVFFINILWRFGAVFFLLPVREAGALRVRTAIRDLSKITPKGVKAMRALSRSSDVATREHAIESVASQGLSLIADEVIKALHDPSPRVRRQAALALIKLNDVNAAQALIHQLVDHPDLVEEETVEALGQIGGSAAVQPLLQFLRDPRSLVRRAAARALGRIGDPSAIPELMETASSADPDVRRASLQALRILHATDAAAVIARALDDPLPSVRIAAAEAVADLNVTEAAAPLRRSLERYDDEASSELAYALGVVGSYKDLPLILHVASHCVSVITRRRCLLGVATMLGVEREAYKLVVMEGMTRDAAILAKMAPLTKRSKRMRVALEKFSMGDDAGALSAVAGAVKEDVVEELARHPVPELFLIVACYLAARESKLSEKVQKA